MHRTLVLVHGGSHGQWCWEQVQAGLSSRGRSSAALDLPGCGQDATPRSTVDLSDEVEAIVSLIDRLPGGPVTLVGHSIGGMPLPAVAHARPDRVDSLVFVAAVVLRRGERGLDMIPADRRPSYRLMAEASGENSLLPDFDETYRRFFPSLPVATAREVYARLTPQPFGPYCEPASVGIDDVHVPRAYVLIDDDVTFPPDVAGAFAERADVVPIRVAGDHCLMLTNPNALVDVLVEALEGLESAQARNRG